MEVKMMPLHEGAKFVGKMTKGSAAIDLCAMWGAVIKSGATEVIGTGWAIELPEGSAGLVLSRSGLAAKHGVFVLNAPGLIDSDYRGEIKVILCNGGEKDYVVMEGDRIAQLMVVGLPEFEVAITDELAETERGEGGLGSTGR